MDLRNSHACRSPAATPVPRMPAGTCHVIVKSWIFKPRVLFPWVQEIEPHAQAAWPLVQGGGTNHPGCTAGRVYFYFKVRLDVMH